MDISQENKEKNSINSSNNNSGMIQHLNKKKRMYNKSTDKKIENRETCLINNNKEHTSTTAIKEDKISEI